jgi:eukaryotic-like serine/threonine-protein kinase
MPDDPRVQRLLHELLDSESTPEEVCRSCPELLPEVRAGWREMCRVRDELEALFPTPREHGADAPALPDDGTDLPRIPGYQVEALLGRGGMGVVFRARHLRLNRLVALKMVLAGAYAGPQERERFLREAEAVAGLRHPNVVQIYDIGDADGRPYFTMEHVEGGSLAERLPGTPQPAREAAALVAALAGATHAAHEGGIVHRDLKPANVLLTADGTPKITDFGLARRFEQGTGLTRTGAPVGTPSYMAPEQAAGKAKEVGPAADVWALGAILYELLTGRPPFQGETSTETVQLVMYQDPVPPSRLNPKVPRDLETICLKCLHKEPPRRYPSAAALAEDVGRFLQGEAITARPEGRLERFARGVRRRPALAVGLAGGLLLAAALVGGGLWVWAERAAAARARERLDSLDRARRDQELAARLDEIQLNRAALVGVRSDWRSSRARADREYEAEFRRAGFGEVHDDPGAVAGRVRASAVRGALVAALDDWSVCAADGDRRRHAWLLEVAKRADRDAAGARDRLRDPAAWQGRARLTELAETALAARASARLLVAIGETLGDSGADVVPFLMRVRKAHPGDFWANFMLGVALCAQRKDSGEAIRYYQAAVALRPTVAIAYHNLGVALLVHPGRIGLPLGRRDC